MKTQKTKIPDRSTDNRNIQAYPRRFGNRQAITSPVGEIFSLQRTIGNRAVRRLLKSGAVQAKLSINRPGDIYEQEADRVAEQVMRMPAPSVQSKPS